MPQESMIVELIVRFGVLSSGGSFNDKGSNKSGNSDEVNAFEVMLSVSWQVRRPHENQRRRQTV